MADEKLGVVCWLPSGAVRGDDELKEAGACVAFIAEGEFWYAKFAWDETAEAGLTVGCSVAEGDFVENDSAGIAVWALFSESVVS